MAADGASMQARTFGFIMKKHIIKGMEKAKADGFAPGDMLINSSSAKSVLAGEKLVATYSIST